MASPEQKGAALGKVKGAGDERSGVEIGAQGAGRTTPDDRAERRRRGSIVLAKVRGSKGKNWGYNAQTEVYEDLVKSGVIASTKVTRTALQNAASIAGLLLTTEAVVVEKKEEKPAPAGAPPAGGMGGMY